MNMDVSQKSIAIISDDTFIDITEAMNGLKEILAHSQDMGMGELPVTKDDICRRCGIPPSTFDHYRNKNRIDGKPVLRSYKMGKHVLVYPSEFREDLQKGIHPGVCAKM